MTHEEFAHICLSIKDGNTKIEIPCCANCKYYENIYDGVDVEPRYCCSVHPTLYLDDPYVAAWLMTKPEDFCSYYKERND